MEAHMAQDPRIDAYIGKAPPFAQPILTYLRALVHAVIPEAGEDIKWGMPCLTYKGKNVAGMAAFKAHCSFGVHGDGRAIEGMGQYGKIRTMADMPADTAIAKSLIAAKERIDATGTALKIASKPKVTKAEIPMPDDFAAALAKLQGARERFDGWAPSHRREYLEWITEAKRPETRAKRIAEAGTWIAEGKKRNWKYEGC
jgi:uncharacterized protein YdeI (YjbR/CyaY-like superfamily)